VARGELLLSVPAGCVLTPAVAAAALQPWLARCLPALTLDDGHDVALLALWVLAEAGRPQSAWRAYLRELPPRGTYSCVLSEWRDDELALLGDQGALAAAQARRAELARDFARTLAAINAALGSSSAQDLVERPFYAYPNPAKNTLNLVMIDPALQQEKVIMTNISGQIVKTWAKIPSASTAIPTLDISELPSGLYILNVGKSAQTISIARD
jgi:hypothetical protein